MLYFKHLTVISSLCAVAMLLPASAQAQSKVDSIVKQLMPPSAAPARSGGEYTARRWGAPKEKTRGYSSEMPSGRASQREVETTSEEVRKTVRSKTYRDDIHFKSGSAVLTQSGKNQLDTILVALTEVREKTRSLSDNKDDVKFQITGHTDAHGSDAYNRSLSMARAHTVRTYLKNKGYNGDLRARGEGETNPLPGSDPFDGRNRRVEVFGERVSVQ